MEDDLIEAILSFKYGRPLTFLALSLLYDDNNWGNIKYHEDHIFPQALFTRQFMTNNCLSADQQEKYNELMNRIGNLELLLPAENQEKSDTNFEEWLPTRETNFRVRHLIPQDNTLLRFDKFEEFIEVREELIRQRLRTIFALPAR